MAGEFSTRRSETDSIAPPPRFGTRPRNTGLNRRLLQERSDLDRADEEFGPFDLDQDLTEGQAGASADVNGVAVDDVGDRVPLANDFNLVPFAGGLFDVVPASGPEDVFPFEVATPSVVSAAIPSDGFALFVVVKLLVGATWISQDRLVLVSSLLPLIMMKSPQPPSMIWHSTDRIHWPPAALSGPTQCNRMPELRAALFSREPQVFWPHLNSTIK